MRILLIVLVLAGVAGADTPRRRIVIEPTTIEIYDPIRFVGTSATIAATSTKMLDSVAATLKGNPSIQLMGVVASGVDAPRDQLVLGERRARAVIAELVRRGVAAKRLRAMGQARPDRGNDPTVGLLILERGPGGGCGS